MKLDKLAVNRKILAKKNTASKSEMLPKMTPETLKAEYEEVAKENFNRKVKKIQNKIRKAYFNGDSCVWVTFWAKHGDEGPILNYFRECGFEVGAPTSSDSAPEAFTDWLFRWATDDEDMDYE